MLCGSTGLGLYGGLRDRMFGARGTWDMKRCPQCRLAWLDPMPAPGMLGELYEGYLTHHTLPTSAPFRQDLKRAVLAYGYGYNEAIGSISLTARRLGAVLARLPRLRRDIGRWVRWLPASRTGRLLDVGCGNGDFIARMHRLGWEVAGVEPDPEAVAGIRSRYGLSAIAGSLEEAALPTAQYDVVTLSDVIEHVPDPLGTMREVHRVLRPGGWVVINTPNLQSLGHRWFGTDWRGLEPPRHLHLFSPQSLRCCLERTGFALESLWTIGGSQARYIWQASALLRRAGALPGGLPGATGKRMKATAFLFNLLEDTLLFARPCGEQLVVIAKKPSSRTADSLHRQSP